MKKFTFSLNSVKEYKDKLLDSLKREHATMLEGIAAAERAIAIKEERKALAQDELNEKNAKGITPFELMNYQQYLKKLQGEVEKDYEHLAKLRREEELKKEELIEMKKETASFEKLEEKKLREYNILAQKSQEQFIEEFVSNKKYAKR